jgi:hypothetical protein
MYVHIVFLKVLRTAESTKFQCGFESNKKLLLRWQTGRRPQTAKYSNGLSSGWYSNWIFFFRPMGGILEAPVMKRSSTGRETWQPRSWSPIMHKITKLWLYNNDYYNIIIIYKFVGKLIDILTATKAREWTVIYLIVVQWNPTIRTPLKWGHLP